MKNFMKAKAGMFLIAMLLLAFTGFGATTSDLVQNSNDQITVAIHADAVNVVAADAVQIQNVVVAESAAQTISVNDVALKTLEPVALFSNPNPLEIFYFPDGYENYRQADTKNITQPPSKTNLARDCTATS